jgi:hypothetical protein
VRHGLVGVQKAVRRVDGERLQLSVVPVGRGRLRRWSVRRIHIDYISLIGVNGGREGEEKEEKGEEKRGHGWRELRRVRE